MNILFSCCFEIKWQDYLFFYLIKNRIKRSSILKDMNFLSLGIFYEILRIFKNLKTFFKVYKDMLTMHSRAHYWPS